MFLGGGRMIQVGMGMLRRRPLPYLNFHPRPESPTWGFLDLRLDLLAQIQVFQLGRLGLDMGQGDFTPRRLLACLISALDTEQAMLPHANPLRQH